jgi:hypothetical protein
MPEVSATQKEKKAARRKRINAMWMMPKENGEKGEDAKSAQCKR